MALEFMARCPLNERSHTLGTNHLAHLGQEVCVQLDTLHHVSIVDAQRFRALRAPGLLRGQPALSSRSARDGT